MSSAGLSEPSSLCSCPDPELDSSSWIAERESACWADCWQQCSKHCCRTAWLCAHMAAMRPAARGAPPLPVQQRSGYCRCGLNGRLWGGRQAGPFYLCRWPASTELAERRPVACALAVCAGAFSRWHGLPLSVLLLLACLRGARTAQRGPQRACRQPPSPRTG